MNSVSSKRIWSVIRETFVKATTSCTVHLPATTFTLGDGASLDSVSVYGLRLEEEITQSMALIAARSSPSRIPASRFTLCSVPNKWPEK